MKRKTVVTAVTTADAIDQRDKTTMQVTLMVTPALDTPIECLRTPSKQNPSLGRLGSNFNNLSEKEKSPDLGHMDCQRGIRVSEASVLLMLALHEVRSASCAANASAMPWSINALSWALVTGVVVVVVAGDALVVLFFGAISFKSPSNKMKLV
ncbi:hypothetical protein Tco_0514008 [Tanacetum coccineum]